MFLARQIQDTERLTVLSSSLTISIELAALSNVEIIQLGGPVRKSSASTIGVAAQNMIQQFSTNTLFLGVDGIDLNFGISTTNQEVAELNKLMIKNTDRVVVLADSTKMNKKGFGRICDIEDIDIIITDDNTKPSYIHSLEERGIEVIVAS